MRDFKFLGHEQKGRLNFLLMKRWWKCHVSCISSFNNWLHSSYWPEVRVTREWDKAVLSLFASPSENLIKVLPLRDKKVRGSYSNGNFFKLACSWALNGSPHSKKEKRRRFSPHSPTQQGREAWGRGYNRQDIRELVKTILHARDPPQ